MPTVGVISLGCSKNRVDTAVSYTHLLPRRKLFHGDSSFPLFAKHSNFTVMEKPFVHVWKLRSLPAWNIRYTPPLALVPISCFLRCTGWFEKPKSGQPAQYIMIFLA